MYNADHQQETVVLIHGLCMRGFCMALLARRLQQLGYHTVLFSYPSLQNPVPTNALALAARVKTLTTPVVHFVAHSLGGLIVRHLVARETTLPPGRVVTLSTPHQGSQVARQLYAGRLRFILRRSIEQGLLGDVPPWPAGRELGSLAGTLNVGLGRLFGPVPAPADGTVTVMETYLPSMTDHLCLPVSHTGMLLSAAVVVQVGAFLAGGRFYHSGKY